MALDYFQVEGFPDPAMQYVEALFRVTAKDAGGLTDATYVGTVHFTSTDPAAVLPADYTFLLADAGTKIFEAELATLGSWYITATDLAAVKSGRQQVDVIVRPLGWGHDPYAISGYGAATTGVGASIRSALALSTHEVEVTVTNLVQDNSPFLPGDALNPATWMVQRLDTSAFLNVVSVQQTGSFKYVLLCLEEFGPVSVQHRASTATLLDTAGNLINMPRQADFAGILDEDKLDARSRLAKKRLSPRDYANAQTPVDAFLAGTLQLGADGDYQTVTGVELVKKLIYRRLMSSPGDFFHLPEYGIGLRSKEQLPASDLVKLKASVEGQVRKETEVDAVNAAITLASNGVLTVQIRARLKKTGEDLSLSIPVQQSGVVL